MARNLTISQAGSKIKITNSLGVSTYYSKPIRLDYNNGVAVLLGFDGKVKQFNYSEFSAYDDSASFSTQLVSWMDSM